jgi:hypothetical protein
MGLYKWSKQSSMARGISKDSPMEGLAEVEVYPQEKFRAR